MGAFSSGRARRSPALPLIFGARRDDETASGVPLTVKYSFQLVHPLCCLRILWTVFTSKNIRRRT